MAGGIIAPALKPTVETVGPGPETFTGQAMVVTRAGQGIGHQVARRLAALAARVTVAVVAAQDAEAAGEIMAPDGAARFIQADIADEALVTGFVGLAKGITT